MKKSLLLLFTVVGFSTLYAQEVDPLTVIQYPLTSRPAIQEKGGDFEIICDAAASASSWQAKIYTAYNEADLSLSTQYNSELSQWILTATIPADAPAELYSLEVSASGGISDQVAHAVKVVLAFRDSYYFVHVPDMHLPSVSWVGYYDDNNTIPEFLQIFKELEIINPEFVLQTGDLVDNGRNEDQFQTVQPLLFDIEVPMFITGGNHDLWYDGHDYWHQYINPVMDYSFNYGDHHFAGMEMFDVPTVTFTAEQMAWLQEDLQQSLDDGDALRTLFYHYDESRQITADFVDDYSVDLLLYGHTHINGEQMLGSRNAPNLNTSFTMNDNGEYRLIKVSDDQIQAYPRIQFRKLKVDYSPANDGSNWRVRATVQNQNPVAFENGLLKFHVLPDAAGYSVNGGTLAQVIEAPTHDIYYVNVDIAANATQEVLVESNNPPVNEGPEISSYSPAADTSIFAGIETPFSIQADDNNGDGLSYTWYQDGQSIAGANQSSYSYTPDRSFKGIITLKVRVSDGEYFDEREWIVEVLRYVNKPTLQTSVVNFFRQDEEITIEWFEPSPINARFEFGVIPGIFTGSVSENGGDAVIFVPEEVGMGLGRYYCRITDGVISSDPFIMVIESPTAPRMTAPIGNIEDLSPSFSWEAVPGVPYYMIICSDREVIINEDPETGEINIEGANPIWSVLTSSNIVPYGIPDPSGTFTSVPAPLIPGNSYWWVVLNCYGNSPELTSPVQSGISKFTIALPPPDIEPPILVSPNDGDTLSAQTISFEWQDVENASTYHFYPFKIEEEMGIEIARGIWGNTIATTENIFDYAAGNLLQNGRYRWKVAAVADNGVEIHSEPRTFYYQAPAARITIITYDTRNTTSTSDDARLPRVNVRYSAIDGVYSGLPLSTDLHGVRSDYSIAPGRYRFEVEKDAYDTKIDSFTFVNGQNYTLHFRLAPSRSRITGKVVDNLDQNISDATIKANHTLHPTIQKIITTDALGNFTLSVIPGPYQITATKNGYTASEPTSISVESGVIQALPNPIELVKNTNIISGTVVNSAQQSLLNARASIRSSTQQYQVYTDNNGHFQFTIENGTWSLHVSKEGFVSPEARSITVSGGSNIVVSPPLVMMPNAAIVQGTITDGFRLLADVAIEAYPPAGEPYETVSDDFGQFTLNIPPGTYTLNVEKTGYSYAQISLNAGETQSGLEIVLTPVKNTVKGKVTTDGYTPVALATVTNENKDVETSDGGRYQIGMNSGEYVISATKEGYTSSPAETLSVTQGQTIEQVDFILSPNASVIKGQVSSDGGAVRNASVYAFGILNLITNTDNQGNYVLNLESGAWHLVASKEGFLAEEIADSVKVGVGQTVADIDFALTPNVATLTGTVTDQGDGSPLRNTTVKIVSKNLSTESAVDGGYTLYIEPGSYQIEVSKPGYGINYFDSGSLAGNQTTTLDFALRELPSRFTGSVLNEEQEPLTDAMVMAISYPDSFITTTSVDGSYRLDVQAGTYEIIIQKSGFETYSPTEFQTIGPDEHLILDDAVLIATFGDINGSVTDSGTDLPMAGVKISIRNASGFAAQTSSGEDGSYNFLDNDEKPTLLPGTYRLIASKTGFQSDTTLGIVLDNRETETVNPTLTAFLGEITGTVSTAGDAVAGATISARSTASQTNYTTTSRPDGNFAFSSLPPGDYKILVAKNGYSSPNPQIISTGTHLDLVLTKNDGRILGQISDAGSDMAIPEAKVLADDQHGSNGTAYSDASGMYDIRNLPRTHAYQVTVSKRGYLPTVVSALSATDSTYRDFQLERLTGDISGTVLAEDETGFSDVAVHLHSDELEMVDTTDAAGEFSFPALPSNEYTLSVSKIGYSSNPFEQTVDLWQGGTVTDVDFTLREARAATLKIIGPDELSNSAAQLYTFAAKTSDKREASVDLLWEIDDGLGVDSLTQSGVLDPQNDFVGNLKIKLTDQHSGIYVQKSISVFQDLSPDHAAMTITNQAGVSLELEENSVPQKVSIQLKTPKIADNQRNTRLFEVIGDVYQFTPEGFELSEAARLTLPIPSDAEERDYIIGKWNSRWLQWESAEDQQLKKSKAEFLKTDRMHDQLAGDSQISIDIEQIGRYAVIAQAEPLGIRDISILPNPFSPLTGPVEIGYQLSSDQTAFPLVTIKIYNMNGDLVKKLISSEPQPRGANVITWDGQTEHDNAALNGRYLIQFLVKDIKGEKEKLKTFVLIK